ncbi:MAG: hypothetical protein FWD58_06315 [Firmicutes bacterium]|nr:hypothetical protein [Bacillota bacterium]
MPIGTENKAFAVFGNNYALRRTRAASVFGERLRSSPQEPPPVRVQSLLFWHRALVIPLCSAFYLFM